jgi:hypothetical protein
MPRSYALSPLLLVAGRPASSFEATRVMGGSCGGKGEMGELDTQLALSERRGDEKCSLCCVGDGSGTGRGSALRFAWPGRRYENMFEGAMGGRRRGSASTRLGARRHHHQRRASNGVLVGRDWKWEIGNWRCDCDGEGAGEGSRELLQYDNAEARGVKRASRGWGDGAVVR